MSKPLVLTPYENELWEQAYQQGRADALTEMITHISACENEAFDNVEPLIGSVLMAIRCKAEQLKEQKE